MLYVASTACSLDKSGLSQPTSTPIGSNGGSGGTATGGSGGGGGMTPITGTGGTVITGEGGAGGGQGGGQGGNDETGNGGAGGNGGGGSGNTGGATGGSGAGGGGAGGGGVGGVGGVGGAGGTPVISTIGCADGTREAFASVTNFPNIAGCNGAWLIPGVLTPESMAPACGRKGGNSGAASGTITDGTGCTVEDLCAEGWHVCTGAPELTALNVRCTSAGAGIPAATNAMASRLFYVTRQHGGAGATCMPNDMVGVNNIHGCGNFGLPEAGACSPPFDFQMSHTECGNVPNWSCSDMVNPGNTADEALVVFKNGAPGGGVLCCRTPATAAAP